VHLFGFTIEMYHYARSHERQMYFRLFRYVEFKEVKFEMLSKIIASLPQHKSWCTLWQISGELDEELSSQHLAF